MCFIRVCVTKLTIVGMALLLVPTLDAQTPHGKRSWEWTREDRLEARFDAKSVMQRAQARQDHLNHLPPTPGGKPPQTGLQNVIDGDRNPELFLPVELFVSLVEASFILAPDWYPDQIRRWSNDVLSIEDDWKTFSEITEDLVADIRSELEGNSPEKRQKTTDGHVSARCALITTAAIQRSRATFGHTEFDRFLYTVVTRNKSVASRWIPGEAAKQRQALEERDKCQ
jgi:hypothetical protein